MTGGLRFHRNRFGTRVVNKAVKIGLIGAGKIGGTLAKLFVDAGHDVFVSNSRGPETLAELARLTGARAATTKEATQDADVVVITIPMIAVPTLADDLFGDDVVIIDTNNYYPQRDGHIEAIENGQAESEWTSQQLQRPVIKAFNNINYRHLTSKSRPAGDPSRIALPVAGAPSGAKAIVVALMDELGFASVDAGSLAESWRQQPGTPVYGADADVEGTMKLLAEAEPTRLPEWRA